MKILPPTALSILVAESNGFPPAAAERLRGAAHLKLADLNRAELLQEAPGADVLWVRLRHQIDAEVMRAAPRLKMIVTATTGLNHIDLAEAERRGIHILSLQGEIEFLKGVRATAEHTLGLLLAVIRKTAAASASVLRGEWNRDLFRGDELYGKTAGVVGYGRLGRIVARYLRAFEMRVLASDPQLNQLEVEAGIELVALPQLLRQAEVVTLHVNLCAETRGFFGAAQFNAMKRGAWLVNTSRGELLDEQALLAALSAGQLAGAALDVLSNESPGRMEHHPLVRYARQHNNLLLTPHLGGCTSASMEKTELFLADKLHQALAGREVTA